MLYMYICTQCIAFALHTKQAINKNKTNLFQQIQMHGWWRHLNIHINLVISVNRIITAKNDERIRQNLIIVTQFHPSIRYDFKFIPKVSRIFYFFLVDIFFIIFIRNHKINSNQNHCICVL